ncbi:hypothetical protein [Microbacterium sp. As-52]|uniref:hypothetical protein n=1 Tax=Microbacterium sp. As-52 TaxID=3390503 RepID=UPI003CF32CF8
MSLRLGGIRVARLRATGFDSDSVDEEEIVWKLTVIDKLLSTKKPARAMFGTLRAASEDGWAEIEVSGIVYGARNVDPEVLHRDVLKSEAAETLFDFARSHLTPLLAQVGSSQSVPLKAPDPDFRFVEREEFEQLLAKGEEADDADE